MTGPSSPSSLTWASPRSSTTCFGRLGSAQALGEHVLRLVARQRAVGDEVDQLGEPVGRERQHLGREPALVEVGEHITDAPVGDVLRGAAAERDHRGLGVVGEPGRGDEDPRVGLRVMPQSLDEPGAARRRQLAASTHERAPRISSLGATGTRSGSGK